MELSGEGPLIPRQNRELRSFRQFIGASGYNITPQTCVAIVEGGYDEKTHIGKVIYCSPHAQRKILPIARFFIADFMISSRRSSIDILETELLNFEETRDLFEKRLHHALTVQGSEQPQLELSASTNKLISSSHAIQDSGSQTIPRRADRPSHVQRFIDHLTRRKSTFSSEFSASFLSQEFNFESETGIGYCIIAHRDEDPSLIDTMYRRCTDNMREINEAQIALQEHLDKKHKEHSEHADNVFSSLFAAMPGLKAKVYHGKEMSELAKDQIVPSLVYLRLLSNLRQVNRTISYLTLLLLMYLETRANY